MSNETHTETTITPASITDYAEVWRKEKQLNEQKSLSNKVIVFAKLKELGIKKVMVNYEGSGDSGDFEKPYLVNEEDLINDSPGRWASNEAYEKTVFATEKVTIYTVSSHFDWQTEKWINDGKDNEVTLGAAIQDIAYGLLEAKHPGWEINDGADGKLIIDVETQTITLDHNEYEMTSTNYVYSWEENGEQK